MIGKSSSGIAKNQGYVQLKSNVYYIYGKTDNLGIGRPCLLFSKLVDAFGQGLSGAKLSAWLSEDGKNIVTVPNGTFHMIAVVD